MTREKGTGVDDSRRVIIIHAYMLLMNTELGVLRLCNWSTPHPIISNISIDPNTSQLMGRLTLLDWSVGKLTWIKLHWIGVGGHQSIVLPVLKCYLKLLYAESSYQNAPVLWATMTRWSVTNWYTTTTTTTVSSPSKSCCQSGHSPTTESELT